jgi:hypothetical protein
MALGFSSGLLTGLQTFGQGGGAIPADPRQRNAMQAAGVTNPLLQQFGQGLGGILGTDMRSPMEQFGSAIQGIDTSTPEGKKALLTALAKVDPISAVKMNEAFRQEAIDAPKRAAELARIEAQTAASKAQAETRNISYVEKVPVLNPITNEPIPNQFTTVQRTMTQVKDAKGNWIIPEEAIKSATAAGITNQKLNEVIEQETIEYFIDDKGKRRMVSYTEGKPFEIVDDEKVELDPAIVEKWRGVGEVGGQADLPTPPPPLETQTPRTPTTRSGQAIPTGGSVFPVADGLFTGGTNRSVREQRGR